MSNKDKTKKQIDETNKDQKLDKVFWFKVALSLVFGVGYGVLKFNGFFAFVTFIIANIILTSFYFSKFISSEDIDYQSEVFLEGLNVSVPLFLLSWILTYTMDILLIQGYPTQEVKTSL